MPTLRGDIEYLKNQGKKITSAGGGFVANAISGTKESQTIKALEFGLFNWLRVLGVIIGIIIFLTVFTPRFSEGTFWIILLLFLVLYGFFFRDVEKRNGGVTGFSFTLVSDIITIIFSIITGMATMIFELGKNIGNSLIDIGKDLLNIIREIISEIAKDIFDFFQDFVKSILDLFVELITEIVSLCKEIVISIISMIGEFIKEISNEIMDIFSFSEKK